jgi:hypothetical protein
LARRACHADRSPPKRDSRVETAHRSKKNPEQLKENDMGAWYEIRVGGQLDPDWADWFEGMQIDHVGQDETVLKGRVRDQAALYGMLNKLRNLGVELLDVQRRPARKGKTPR